MPSLSSSNIVPLRPPQRVSDISRFEHFSVPSRKLTARETAIYRKLADDWARLDATAQTQLYAALLQDRLTDQLEELFLGSLTRTYERLDGISDPRVAAAFQNFAEGLTQLDAQVLMGFKCIGAKKMESIVEEPYPEGVPAQPNVWKRMFGRAA